MHRERLISPKHTSAQLGLQTSWHPICNEIDQFAHKRTIEPNRSGARSPEQRRVRLINIVIVAHLGEPVDTWRCVDTLHWVVHCQRRGRVRGSQRERRRSWLAECSVGAELREVGGHFTHILPPRA